MGLILKGTEPSTPSENYLYLHGYNLQGAVLETKVENIMKQPSLQRVEFLLCTEVDPLC